MEGHWKFLSAGWGGGGVFEAMYENKLALEFSGGGGECKTKTFHGGSKGMDIFWNCTMTL